MSTLHQATPSRKPLTPGDVVGLGEGAPVLVGLIDEAHAAVRLVLARWERDELVDDEEHRALFETMVAARRKLDAAKRLANGDVTHETATAPDGSEGGPRCSDRAGRGGVAPALLAKALAPHDPDFAGGALSALADDLAILYQAVVDDEGNTREDLPPSLVPTALDRLAKRADAARDVWLGLASGAKEPAPVARAAFVLETRGPWAGRPADGRWYPAVAGTWNQTGWDDERASTFECQRQASSIMAQMAAEAAEVEFRVRRVDLAPVVGAS